MENRKKLIGRSLLFIAILAFILVGVNHYMNRSEDAPKQEVPVEKQHEVIHENSRPSFFKIDTAKQRRRIENRRERRRIRDSIEALEN